MTSSGRNSVLGGEIFGLFGVAIRGRVLALSSARRRQCLGGHLEDVDALVVTTRRRGVASGDERQGITP